MPQLAANGVRSMRDPADAIRRDAAATPVSVLTARERAVLELLKTGKPNKIIAHKLGMSLSTAKIHVHNIIRKLKVKNRTEAVIAAGRLSFPHDRFVETATKAGHLDLALSASKDGLEITPDLANQLVVPAPRVSVKAH
jgi:DNA-binding CsgD family transcriptional regulator